MGTSKFCLFADKLFDSVNGYAVNAKHGKFLRTAITERSPHHEFWKEAIPVLRTMKCERKNGTKFVPPSMKNWIETILGFKELWNRMKTVGYDFLIPRNVNQDALENFFGGIRLQGARNNNPTCTSFESSYRTLIINNFTSHHSPGANCLEDDAEAALKSITALLSGEDSMVEEMPDSPDFPPTFTKKGAVAVNTHAYIAGSMARKILRRVECKVCKDDLLTTIDLPHNQFIQIREYKRNALLKPNTIFVNLFGDCVDVAHSTIPKLANEPCIKKN